MLVATAACQDLLLRQIVYSTEQGSAQLYVKVLDYDAFRHNDHVDDIYIPIKDLNPGESTQMIRTGGVYGNGIIELSFQLNCRPHFYGRNCAVFCIPIDIDGVGHFDCGPSGVKTCRKGWRDPGNHCLTRKQIILNSVHTMAIDHILHVQLNAMGCLLYTSPSPRDATLSRMPSSA